MSLSRATGMCAAAVLTTAVVAVVSQEAQSRGSQVPCYAAPIYPGDAAPRTVLARWMGAAARAAGLPPELPVMAALADSGLRNRPAPAGADSVGFFQMRVGIWDKGEYAGYPSKPELQVKWFIDQAIAVKAQRYAVRSTAIGKDPSSWGEWIADVERPAEQFRGRYQLRLAEARRLLGTTTR